MGVLRSVARMRSRSRIGLPFRGLSSGAEDGVDLVGGANPRRDLEIWAWGKGDSGQLGLGDEETQKFPCIVSTVSSVRTTRLAPMQGVLAGSVHDREDRVCSRAEERKVGGVHANASDAGICHWGSRNFGGAAGSGGAGQERTDISAGIACGLFHSGFWADGKLWMWGKGEGGRLGFGSEGSIFEPTLNPYLDRVKSLALGGLHSVALREDGSVCTWGFGGFGALGHGVYTKETRPREVKHEWADEVGHIAAGGSHTAAITNAGVLYTWGRDEGEGRLGHGLDMADGCVQAPMQVEALPVPVHAVACGGFFTMALSCEGQLWGWGGNSNYELGTRDRRNDWRPRPVAQLKNVQIRQVACGGYHTAALTEDGQVLTWGHGGHGQLGHGLVELGKLPTVVQALQDKCIVNIACGSQWTVAVTDSGELYAWGKNRDWQIGVPGLPDIQPKPVQICLKTEQGVVEPGAIVAAAGASHGLCLRLPPS